MRDLKFRVWNGKSFKVYPVGIPIYDVKRFQVSECTGLVDDNDKEIYENDIIVTEYEDEVLHMAVVFIEGGYDLIHPESGRRHALSHVNYFSSKIVGNTYQHPELLAR